MADTIFSRIIAGEIPCHRVYEDDLVLAFLDQPTTPPDDSCLDDLYFGFVTNR